MVRSIQLWITIERFFGFVVHSPGMQRETNLFVCCSIVHLSYVLEIHDFSRLSLNNFFNNFLCLHFFCTRLDIELKKNLLKQGKIFINIQKLAEHLFPKICLIGWWTVEYVFRCVLCSRNKKRWKKSQFSPCKIEIFEIRFIKSFCFQNVHKQVHALIYISRIKCLWLRVLQIATWINFIFMKIFQEIARVSLRARAYFGLFLAND